MPDLLLHSLKDFPGLVQQLVTGLRPSHVLEVGSESGEVSALLADLVVSWGGRLTVIDPQPAPIVQGLADRGALRLVAGCTPEALDLVGVVDLAILDGDHNYATLRGELSELFASSAPVVLLHDVGWPWARRDLYYDPGRLAVGDVHPCSYDHGVVPDRSEPLLGGGFRGRGAFAIAIEEGGPRNGVLTAVEDFLAERPELRFRRLDAIFGFGVIYARDDERAAVVDQVLDTYDSPLLSLLERNRVELYCQVIALQDRADALEGQVSELRVLVEHHVAAPQTVRGLARRVLWPILQYARGRLRKGARKP